MVTGSAGGKPAQRPHQLVEERAVARAVASFCPGGFRGGLHHLQAVPDGDLVGPSAFRGHDHSDAGQRDQPGCLAGAQLAALLLHGGEPFRVAGAGHRGSKVLRRRGGQQPAHAGTDHVSADQDCQAAGMPGPEVAQGGAGAAVRRRGRRQDPPVGCLLGSGCGPPLLPGLARHGRQPVQHAAGAPAHLGLVLIAAGGERLGEHPGQDASPRGSGLFPCNRVRPRRELPSQLNQAPLFQGPQPDAES